ncbi:MAG: hypothetical protein U0821_13780 [Chloroflexota bacterium]
MRGTFTGLARGVAAVLLALVPAVALAQTQPAPPAGAPSKLQLAPAQPSSAKGRLTLAATLTTAEGKPLSNQSVDFYQHVDLLGPRESYLGSGTTDSTGRAAVSYQPSQKGQQKITARFHGAEGLAGTSASGEIQVSDVVSPFPEERLPFAPIRGLISIGIAALTLGFWVVLIGVLLSTVLGIRAAGGAHQAAGR